MRMCPIDAAPTKARRGWGVAPVKSLARDTHADPIVQTICPPRYCTIAVATWNGSELPAQLVDRAETQLDLERAASRPD